MISSQDRLQKILDVASLTLSKEARNKDEPEYKQSVPDSVHKNIKPGTVSFEEGSLTPPINYDEPSSKFFRNLANASMSFAPIAKPITAATKLIANDAAMQAASKPAVTTLKDIYERYSPSVQGLFNSKPQVSK